MQIYLSILARLEILDKSSLGQYRSLGYFNNSLEFISRFIRFIVELLFLSNC